MEKQITQVRYSLKDALRSVPYNKIKVARKEVKELLKIKSRQQLYFYETGAVMPTLAQAKAVEDYFINNWGITNVWKEFTERKLKYV